ncbi:MAG: protein-methionine-sulfoxide reductase heme-binding subunit MsrQ [Rhodobacteraceae bacterium]|nr:protein-methionine-sulfoxide reductase heme-binding subunit MsrQ [Paracoccaceae bacterium]
MQRLNNALRRIPPWLLYVLGAAYGGWLFYLAATGGLGVEPINTLERLYGEITLQLIVLGLAVTPLRRHAGVNLMPMRRAIGVLAFFFLGAHLLVWAVLDVQRVSAMWADILERPYVTIGMAGFLLLLPLGLTSNNWAVHKLGAATWRKLHKLVYPAAILGAVHFIWLTKGFQWEPLIYLTIILGLLALRIRPAKPRID